MDFTLSPRPLPSAMADFKQEKCLHFSRGWVETESHVWDGPDELCTVSDGFYLFNLALSPRLETATMGYVGVGEREAMQTAGRTFMIPPMQTVKVRASSKKRQRTFQCLLAASTVDEILGATPEWRADVLEQTVRLGGEVEWLLWKMYQELRNGGFGAPIVIEGFAQALAVAVVRKFALEPRRRTSSKGGLSPWRMRILRDRVYADGPSPTVPELAAHCGLSVRHLSRAFKAETGETLKTFIKAAVIERARSLLSKSERPVCEVARALGFSDPTSFAYVFRRATGMAPSEYAGRRGASIDS